MFLHYNNLKSTEGNEGVNYELTQNAPVIICATATTTKKITEKKLPQILDCSLVNNSNALWFEIAFLTLLSNIFTLLCNIFSSWPILWQNYFLYVK